MVKERLGVVVLGAKLIRHLSYTLELIRNQAPETVMSMASKVVYQYIFLVFE